MTILIKNAERNDKNTLGDILNPIKMPGVQQRSIEQHQIILMRKKKLKKIEI